MSLLLRAHQPCLNPNCLSSDALSIYSDHTFCFSCEEYVRTEDTLSEYSFQFMPWRGISKSTMEFFNVKTKVTEDGTPVEIGFPYPSGMIKVRGILEKTFRVHGSKTEPEKNLFGMDKFPVGSGENIIITEGELDAMSVYEMLGRRPVVSLSSATFGKDVRLAYDYLNSFERIYLCLDNDIPGEKAMKNIAMMFDFNKVYVIKMARKDANEYLQAGENTEFRNLYQRAKRFLPEGIISSYSEIDDIIDDDTEKPSQPYPFETLQDMTYGIRFGEVNLFTALEGIGKTEIFRAIEYHLLKTTDENIGIIHLEEGKSRMIKGLVGYELETPAHLPDRNIPKDDIKAAYRRITRRDDRVHIYTHFSSDDLDTIIGTIRFLVAACGCKYIFLDHISMLVTGRGDGDEREALDYLSTRFEWLVEELDFTLFLISHVNDEGLTRGSRNISKTCDLWVHLTRNKTAETLEERNTTYLTVNKNRFAGRTGPAGKLIFSPETFKITEALELPA